MRAPRICNVPDCPNPTDTGRCTDHRRQAEQIRGSAHQRGYGTAHQRFRQAVLQRDKTCVEAGCMERATVADHWPLSRRDLTAQGLDPNDPKHGRGLCAQHHNESTARLQQGGWHRTA